MIRSLSEAFAKAGYTLTNPRNQWSAIKADETAVALTVWSDEINKTKEPWVLDTRAHPKLDIWIGKVGNSVRKKHIQYSLDNCRGHFDLILCKAVDPEANPRKIEWAKPWPVRVGTMESESFNSITGEFLLTLQPVEAN